MHDFFTDESFDLEKTYEYILSIQVCLDGFSFSVKLPGEKKILAFKNIQLKISRDTLITRHFQEWVASEMFLQKPFKKVHIIIFNENFSLIPEEYFHNKLRKEIPHLLFEKNSEYEIAENVLDKLKAKLIFALPTELNNAIQNHIGECEIMHPVKIIINNPPEIKDDNALILLLDVKYFYAVLFSQNKVLLVNSFKMNHVNDIIYYILTALQQLGISPKKTSLFLADAFNNLPEIENSLNPHFTEIKNLNSTSDFSNSELMVQFSHQHIL